MWRDRWFVLGVLGLGAWTARVDLVLVLVLVGFVALVLHRHRIRRRGTP